MADYFERGEWRKVTKEESIKYKPQFDELRRKLSTWYFATFYEFFETNNSEGGNRLMLVTRGDNGRFGVANSIDI
jgi:hypothetical protein